MALIPANFVDAVVTLEARAENDEGEEIYVPVASGVVVGLAEGEPDEEGTTTFRVWLVTANHVLRGNDYLYVKFNTDGSALHLPVSVADSWTGFGDFDIAVTSLNAVKLKELGAHLNFIPDASIATSERMEELGVFAGDGVFVVGFPMRIAGTEKKYAVVRSGVVARFDEEIIEETSRYLIDCAVYPGNSGGLVLLKPETAKLHETKNVAESLAIGIVSAYVPYVETAVSQQTGEPRITFEENSGLARIVPMEAVLSAIEIARAKEHAEVDDEPETLVDPSPED